jgi:hypothetical protein
MEHISHLWKAVNPTNYLLFNIQLDEMQGAPQKAQNLLHVIGNYMCSTDAKQQSLAGQHHMIIFPGALMLLIY